MNQAIKPHVNYLNILDSFLASKFTLIRVKSLNAERRAAICRQSCKKHGELYRVHHAFSQYGILSFKAKVRILMFC